jgi:hypothetical protein
MTRRVRLPQSRRHIWLYDEDWRFLQEWCRARDDLIGPGPAAREIIHGRVEYLRARQLAAIDSSPPFQPDLIVPTPQEAN